jgi:hypothetical protein
MGVVVVFDVPYQVMILVEFVAMRILIFAVPVWCFLWLLHKTDVSRTCWSSGRRHLSRLLSAVLLAMGVAFAGASAAYADDGPQPENCEPSQATDHAGSGMPGWIDDRPVGGTGNTLYEQYGWSGMEWSTCQLAYDGWGPDADIHMPAMVQNPGAWIDTHVGNLLMGGATVLGAFMTQLDQWAGDPGSVMEPIDRSIEAIANTVTTSTWGVWSAVIVVIVACLIVVWAMQGDPRRAMRSVAAVFIAAMMIGALGARWTTSSGGTEPGAVHLGQMFDNFASSVIGSVSSSSSSAGTPNIAYGETLYDQILVPIWVQGAIGVQCTTEQIRTRATGSGAASEEAQLCYDIYHSNTKNWGGVGYTSSYNSVARAAYSYDQSYGTSHYDQLRGISGESRAGLGFKALVTMLLIALIRIPCSLLLLMGLLTIRFVVMFIPLWALFALIEATRATAIGAGKMVFASTYNAAVAGVFGVVHTLIVGKIVQDGYTFVDLLLIIVLTAVVLAISKPFRSVTTPATGDVLSGTGDGVRSTMTSPLRTAAGIAGGIMAYKTYKRVGNVSSEEDKQTIELQKQTQQDAQQGAYTSTYSSTDGYSIEAPRLADTTVKTRNPVKDVQFPIRVRTPLDLSDVDKTTGEVHAKLQNPFQTQKPITVQSPVFLEDKRTPPPPPASVSMPSLTAPSFTRSEGQEAAERLAVQERIRRHQEAESWTPPPVPRATPPSTYTPVGV